MDDFRWDVSANLGSLVSEVTEPELISSCRELLAKQIWPPRDRQHLLSMLAKSFLYPQCTLPVAEAFRPILLDLLERAGQAVVTRGRFCTQEHERLCVAVGKVLELHPDAFRFLMKYLRTAPPVFERLLSGNVTMQEKKKKKRKLKPAEPAPPPSLVDILATCSKYLRYSREAFVDLWDWSPVLKLVGHKDVGVRWYAAQIAAILTDMADRPLQTLLGNRFTADDVRRLTLQREEENRSSATRRGSGPPSNPGVTFGLERQKRAAHTMRELVAGDLSRSVAAVCGVLLPVKAGDETKDLSHTVVPVASTARNLHSLALAVSSGTAVLLEGAVGCGKSALVDHLAAVTGRGRKTPDLLKVQLGDQTDSKALIGTYRCTDIPGEFVWQPGALTQAVIKGHWIVLEDIDYAPMDVVSVLVPLLEAGSLSLPGHGDVVRAAPGFQLFATRRLAVGPSGLFRQHVSQAALLDRLWSKVSVEPLSRAELQQVVVTLHPQLTSVVDKLLDIFIMLSSGSHGDLQESKPGEQHGRVVTPAEVTGHQGRLISTRDLLKWCGRIAVRIEGPSANQANSVFLEAMDCFGAALPKPTTRASVAEAIGVRLGLCLEKCSFFVGSYKPNMDIRQDCLAMGRARLIICKKDEAIRIQRPQRSIFALTRPASILLERIAVAVGNNEPVLLVGETGTGKTSSVQYLADLTGQRLKVVNMNQQSDSTDLLGGFKPVDFRQLVSPLRESFETLFVATFSRKQNVRFLMHLQECFTAGRWQDLLRLMDHCHQAAAKRFQKESRDEEAETSSGKQSPTLRSQWRSVGEKIQLLKTQLQHSENALAFSFVEGTLVQAVRNGDWVLLDEINLASAETLECLSGVLESTEGTVTLLERGDSEPIVRHKNFRLFACMNPATDIGKKELQPGIRNRFTEFFVDELEEVRDLQVLVRNYLRGLALTSDKRDGIVQFYLAVRKEAKMKLADGTGHRPHYSLRTLCRALRYTSTNPCRNAMRSLYEGFCLSFLTQLDRASHPLVEQLVCRKLIGRANLRGVLAHPIPPPAAGGSHVKVEGYWITAGDGEPEKRKGYVMTPSVKANLRDLARIVSAGSFPVLLQGETSVGKTSLIHYLAMATGNHCVRVNNHEHTDLQEYVGFYAADEMGKLVFKEGVLVDAMRKGHWIILDELNLAPSDVLEALNRLLDDNRELYIPETQEMIVAHPRFMLFATQNPPGQYGGRKVLSRAFRNRFVEIHFDEIPSKELETILHQRCAIPLSYCKKMVAVMLDLQTRRKGSGVFSGKQGFITLRDLFRWAERYRRAGQGRGTLYDWDQHIADDGYLLLAGRVRRPEEQSLIKEVLEKHIRCQIDPDRLFGLSPRTSPITREILERVVGGEGAVPQGFRHVVWTSGMQRLAVLVGQALKFQEPVVLVGETGCGKTTICQLHAALANQKLYTVNCHLHTETSDFLGGLRPVRQHSGDEDEDGQKLFEWCDGPLVQAMREDAAFLIDEISLADDSVLERLNSVLEPERTLLLAERGSGETTTDDVDTIVAGERFFVVATMNPGGDFGKKELSPALRNRFTEIWCPQSTDRSDLARIVEHNLAEGVWLCNQEDGSSGVGHAVVEFVGWFQGSDAGKRCTVSIRDILSWVNFINTCCDAPTCQEQPTERLDTALAYVHGACMVFLDGLGSGTTSNTSLTPHQLRTLGLNFLRDQVWRLAGQEVDPRLLMAVTPEVAGSEGAKVADSKDGLFGIEPFYIPRGPLSSTLAQEQYALNAPTTARNAQRVLRALQLPRALLLEGSPGVGKTSLVAALAKASGHQLVRINLSEQTDVTDLFGADLPVEGGEGGRFAWRDGPLLGALKGGHWIVLDELNLASQSVLEGLNACLDHRAEVYVPELGKTFRVQHEKTRLFACQNPLKQGGGRKGLPRSFLNRFTQVYVEPLAAGDLLFIAHTMYPTLPGKLLEKMVEFNNKLYQETMVECQWGQRGGPWEFNLRDLFRWCDLMVHDQLAPWQPGQHVGLIYRERMRNQRDKEKVQQLFKSVFGDDVDDACEGSRQVHVTPVSIQVGHSFLRRKDHVPITGQNHKIPLQLLHHCLDPMESLMKCVEMNWMTILVGPSASGKTSLIHLLGHLTGHMVRVLAMNSAMDTTELLGGFEQADLNRHWEKALQSLRHVVMATERLLLLANTEEVSQHAPQLLASWAALNNMQQAGLQGEGMSSSNEGLSERKLDMFEQVLSQVRGLAQKHTADTGIDEKVGHVTNMAAQLRTRLEKEGRTIQQGGGGKFEWVDGMLVQALKNGEWLLIDNVNFCSPSVLDRLNALLEPKGILSINERGVVDGHVPTVAPHRDFRLFLAMDPRHGEISRAMRNRGVEVYIVGENEGGAYDRLDLLALLNGIGMTGDQTTGTLLELHENLKLSMPGSEVASLPSMLLAASVTGQLLDMGRDGKSALKEACSDVFVRGQLSKVNKQKAKEIVEKHLDGMGTDSDQLVPVDPINDAASIDGALHPRHLPSAEEFGRNASWAMLRREYALLMCLLGGVQNRAGPGALVRLLRPATLLLLEQATPTDWEARCDWLAAMWTKWLGDVGDGTAAVGVEGAGFVEYMPGIAIEALKFVSQHPLQEKLAGMLDKIELPKEWGVMPHYPLDLNLAPQLLDKLAKLCQERALGSVLGEATAIARRLYLLLRISCTRHGEYSKLRQAVDVKHTPITAIQLSYALHQSLLGIDDLPHPLLAHLYPFFRSLDAFVTDAISTGRPNISEDITYEILLALQWRDRCWQVCDRPIKGSDSFHLGQFALHWAWMTKKLIIVVPRLLLGRDESLPQDLQTVTNRITDHLASIATTRSAPQHQRALQHHVGQPLPYKSRLCAEASGHLSRVCRAADVVGSVARVNVGRLGDRKRKKLQSCAAFAVMDGCSAGRKMVELLAAVAQLNNCAVDYMEDDLLDSIQAIEAKLASHGLYHQDANQHIPMETDNDGSQSEDSRAKADDVAMKIGLWPLCDYMALCAEQVINCNLLVRNAKSEEYAPITSLDELRPMLEFAVNHTPASPLRMLPYTSLLQGGPARTPPVSEVTGAFMAHLWSSPASCQVPLWLSWQQFLGDEDAGNCDETTLLECLPHGPAFLHTPLNTYCVHRLLYTPVHRPRPSKGDRGAQKVAGSKVTTDVPLGQYLEKLEQLRALSELLWSNATTLSSNKFLFRSSSVGYLLLSLSQLLRTLEPLLPTSDLELWQVALDEVVSMATSLATDVSSIAPAVSALDKILLRNVSEPSLGKSDCSDRGQRAKVVTDVKVALESVVEMLHAAGDASADGTAGMETTDWDPMEGSVDGGLGGGVGGHLAQLMALGKGWVRLGLLEVHLLAPRGPVDPAEKKALKLQYVKNEITDISNELQVHCLSSRLLTGRKLEDVPTSLLPERVRLAQGRLALLEERAPELAKQTAFRPVPPKFDALLQDVTHYLTSIGSRSTVEGLLCKLTSTFDSLVNGEAGRPQTRLVQKVLHEETAWQKSQSQFLRRIQDGYPLYRDQWAGLVATASQMQYGIRLAAHALLSQSERRMFCEGRGSVEDLLCSIAEFPAPSRSEDHLASRTILSLVKSLSVYSAVDSEQSEHNKLQMSLLELSLLRIRSRCLLAGCLIPDSLCALLATLDSIAVAWRRAEDAARRRQEEEASLYKYKAKTHGDGLTDEQREEREFRQSFPSFEEDFADITEEPSLESKPELNEPATCDDNDGDVPPISDKQMQQVCVVHRELFTKLVRAGWIRSRPERRGAGDASSGSVLRGGYATTVQLGSKVLPFLDPSLDTRLLGAHLLMIRNLRSSLTPADPAGGEQRPQPYDIYHDGNLAEAVQCRPVLERFSARIAELLEQWPGHPTLKQLMLLMERILEFSITSPLMKFVTGMELLLEKAQEWESNASRAVSVREHLTQITDLVIQWRKLELRCWSACLDTVAYRLEQGTNKWWFHIYQLLQTQLGADATVATDEDGRPDEQTGSEVEDGKGPTESVVLALEQFMEGSSLGEFAARLQMLLAFHCQVTMQPASPPQMELAGILWNLYCYYKQFLSAVEAEIKRRRTPIEKELKGFVKIARWNDVNFWAVKQAVEKSHKTLHKFSKKFETELKEPARCAFTDTKVAEKEEISVEDSAGTRPSGFGEFLTPDDYKSYLEVTPPPAAILGSDKSLHARLPVLLPRMTKLCQSIFKKCPYPALTVAVDEFTGEIVSGVKELQSLDVTKDADKEKQKSEVRRIQQRKRKALADLFRYLTTIGLSYKKGLTLARTTNQNRAMLLPPVDLAVALETEDENLSFSNADTVSLWTGCHHFFVKSIARKAAMQMALAVPSKELGIGNIERCKGFAEHLSLLATTQRQDIIGVTEGLVQTRNILSQLQKLPATSGRHGDDPALPHQQSTASWVATSKELIDLARASAHQYLTLLECCPEEKDDGGAVPSPLPRQCLAAMDTVRKGDLLWEQSRHKLLECQSILEAANQSVEPRANQLVQGQECHLLFWIDVELLDDAFQTLETVTDAFAGLEQLFTLPRGGERSCLATSLTETRRRVFQTALRYGRWKRWVVGNQGMDEEEEMETGLKEGPSSHLLAFADRTESVLTSVLLAVQSTVKSHRPASADSQSTLDENQDTPEEDTEEQEFDLQDGHLVKRLSTAVGHDAVTLDLGRVSKVMGSLLGSISKMRDNCHSTRVTKEFNTCVALVRRLVPILHQYLGLVAFTLNQTVACHRTTCKLLSVLLGIFTELASKGLCLPAEYSDELGGEGATEFKDIEGGGIGEGEGMKDVSDQIENEEQVQDTKKQGEKQEEEDFSNQPDIKDEEQGIEMSDDFQGKLHDADAQDGEVSDEDDAGEHEMDKQMGEVDQQGADMLDERIWGDQDDEEEEGEKKKEEFGEGKGEEKQTDLVAKDDNKGAPEDKGDNEKQRNEDEDEMGENNENQNPNNLEPQDEGEFSDDEVDPRKANNPPEPPIPDDLDIPDDLQLDGGKLDEENEDGAAENQDESNPFDIESKFPDEKDPGSDPDTTEENGEDGNQEEGDRANETEERREGAESESCGEEQEEEGENRNDLDDQDGGEVDEDEGDEKGGVGMEPQEDTEEPIPEDSSADYQPDQAHHPQAMPEPAEQYGQSKETTEAVQEQSAQEDAGKSEEEKNKEKENVGTAESSLREGHEGAVPSQTLPRQHRSEQRQQQNYKRRPGQSDADRSLGSLEERVHKRLRTLDAQEERSEKADQENQNESNDKDEMPDLCEHLKDASSTRYDTQVMDAASEEQLMQEQATPNRDEEDAAAMETDEEVAPLDDQKDEKDDPERMDTLPGTNIKAGERRTAENESDEPNPDVTEGEATEDSTASKVKGSLDPDEVQSSTIHTTFDLLSHDALPKQAMTTEEVEVLRQEMEQQLSMLSQKQGTADEEKEAQETWHRYESLTSGLARDLCEQLRLVLEPTRASKLRGDFRTGKRINMRKVIPYIASGFRKDKIWLRRTKPSKRQYQILLAVDDSSSMADNRSRQLAFESLAVISNALTWLEAGELAVCSFGESVQLLHPFQGQFTDQSGAKILRQFTFSQRKTKIAQLLNYATASMLEARARLHSGSAHAETSQLLLVVSDGRGLFLEGMEAVKQAVRRARDANIFLVFVALDNPENKDSILDIKVPIFSGAGQLPEISTYMEHFPFPFYIILKDIDSMPEILSDALRQWFELVTAGDVK